MGFVTMTAATAAQIRDGGSDYRLALKREPVL